MRAAVQRVLREGPVGAARAAVQERVVAEQRRAGARQAGDGTVGVRS